MSPSSTSQGRRCKKPLTKSSSPRIGFDWSSTQSRRWSGAFHPDDKKGMLVKWAAIWESGMPGGLEARLRRFDGEYRWFLFQAVPLRDESGNIVKWYGSATDIEDRKRTEET